MDKSLEIKENYKETVKKYTPKSKTGIDCLKAFLVGGTICTIGEFITAYFYNIGYTRQDSSAITTVILVFIGALLTGLDMYDTLGKFAGAGSIVPITGFANSIVSPAMEYKKEGYILGVGAKMFTVAGPVIVYGTISSILVGVVYYFLG